MSPFFEREERGIDWRLFAAGLLGLGLLTAGWLTLAAPEENRLSGVRVFDSSGGAVAPRVPRAVERREDTGLSMVRVGLTAEEAGAPSAAVAAQDAPSAAPPAAPANPYAGARAAVPEPASDKELAAAGIPVTASGLTQLGAKKGLMSAVVKKMMDHPRVLKAVLDNKLVVDALMGREISRRNCSDPGALKSALSDSGSGAMANLFPIAQQALSRPESASAMLGSRLGQALMDCPSAKALSSDPSMVMSVAMANPKVLGLVTDPRVAKAVAGNPQAAGMFGQLQSGLGK